MRDSKRKIWQVPVLFDNGKQVIAYSRLTKREARKAARTLRDRYWDVVHAYVERIPGR